MQFEEWGKTPRLFRDVVITEKIDGTNAAVIIEEVNPDPNEIERDPNVIERIEMDGHIYHIGAQSRKRLITPDSDNFGFARWVKENAVALLKVLGTGRHFGEWWGSGIQRGYGLTNGDKRFSLFNTNRWATEEGQLALTTSGLSNLDVVPVLYEGEFDTIQVRTALWFLQEHGSMAAPGYQNPEGVVVFHKAAQQVFKATLENDELSKGEVVALKGVLR